MPNESEPSSTQRELHSLRVDYREGELLESDVSSDAIEQFARWFDEAKRAGLREPNAMTLATADATGAPSARIVLLKDFDTRGFTFYTSYQSRKAGELDANPRASLVFFWDRIERQVRIDGRVEKVSREESKTYFDLRPRNARIGAWASMQSAPLASREELESREKQFDAEFRERYGEAVPLPDHWGGYRVIPTAIEFWQGRPSRLHDRLRYTRLSGQWMIERLSP